MWRWVAVRWATAAASNWLVIIIVSLVSIGLIYVQQLRVTVAKCRAHDKSALRYEALADQLADQLENDRDAAIKAIREADSPCLDANVLDLLRGSPAPGG